MSQPTTPAAQTPASNVGDTVDTPDIPEQPKTYACEVMTNTSGLFTVKTGNTINYTVTYRSDYTTAPYDQSARLLVSSNGRLSTSIALVQPTNITQRIVGSVYYYDYTFTITIGQVGNGTYLVNFLSNGTDASKVTSPITCAQTINVTSDDVPDKVPGLDVTKLLLTGDRSYVSGEKVVFSIRIRNTGETTFTNVKYQDRFWNQYLSYTGTIRGKKSGATSWRDLSGVSSVNTATGAVDISNLASSAALGALAPSQQYEIEMEFISKSPVTWTCNQVYITANDLPGYDDACLGIVPPNTDM